MEISKCLKAFVYQSLRSGNIYSVIKLIFKVHQVLSLLQTSKQILTERFFQRKITYTPANAQAAVDAQEVEKKPTINHLKSVQIELRPFFDGEDANEAKIQEFIQEYNSRFWNRPIDTEGDLLRSIRQRKIEMISQGEKAYIKKVDEEIQSQTKHVAVGLSLLMSHTRINRDPLFPKIKAYAGDRFAMTGDIEYQQTMLTYFTEWYDEVTAPPSLLPSAAHYIASGCHKDPERDA